ncbi:MAG: flagellar biosynthesis protein FlhB [Steroidobacteraceae bacterium]|nr:flagellar biosynthesis protein FlhB [Steroidobacteraceae bacterium]
MAEQADRDQRTEQPTPKRLQDARERGQVPRSRELAGTAVMVSGAATLLLAGGLLAGGLESVMRSGLSLDRAALADPMAALHAFNAAIVESGLAMAPLLGIVFLVAMVAPLATGGFVFSSKALGPDLNRLNPIEGIKRVFGLQGLAELAKALAKFLVVGGTAAAVVWWMLPDMMALSGMPTGPALRGAAWLLGLAGLLMSAALVLVAVVDVPFQVWSHKRNLRMTRQELLDEIKQTEGRPEVRARVRAAQRELARRRMMQDVPRADVVVTNPTHYAVALKYEPGRTRAPRVLAKGRDLVALEIRRVAAEHGVPLFEAPPLARAIYATTELGREIPSGLYLAVAQVLTYVYQLRAARGDASRVRRPVPEVAEEYLQP